MLVHGFEIKHLCPENFCLSKNDNNNFVCKRGDDTIPTIETDSRKSYWQNTTKCKNYVGSDTEYRRYAPNYQKKCTPMQNIMDRTDFNGCI